jgi:hypothetical protein
VSPCPRISQLIEPGIAEVVSRPLGWMEPATPGAAKKAPHRGRYEDDSQDAEQDPDWRWHGPVGRQEAKRLERGKQLFVEGEFGGANERFRGQPRDSLRPGM